MTDWHALFRAHMGSDTTDTIDTSPQGEGFVDCVDCVIGAKGENSERAHSTLLDATDLLNRYAERAAISQFDGGQDRARAEARAWNEVAALWYRQHGSRVPVDHCAGCGKPLGGEADLLLLPHGERAHAGGGYACIHAYGRRWKREATVALAAIGIPRPPEIAAEIEEPKQ